MGKDRGFLECRRKEPAYRPREERLKDFRAVELRLKDSEIREQAARCMDCGVPFCHGCGCPLDNVIPELNEHVYRGQWREALELLLSTNPFPEFTARVCPALCEGSCVLGINDDPVSIRQMEWAIVQKGFERGMIAPRLPDTRRKERIAVVGSGPAGLAAAHQCNRKGFQVVVYENSQRPGGILRYGIPEFKLEKWIVDRRIQLMRDEGIVFETGVEIGKDLSARYLFSRFDAVVLAGGAREPRDLPVPGRNLEGIHFAMTYLVQQNRILAGEPVAPSERIDAQGKKVVIIGGGDTGADCLGSALRQGAEHVFQLEILPEPPPTRAESTPWPDWPLMRRDSSSHKEGGERMWGVATDAFEGDEGRVKKLRCVKVNWVFPGDGGRSRPERISGSEFEVSADLVLLAMGFIGPGKNMLVEELGIQSDDRGFVKRDERGMTSSRGVFVAGDMSAGASLVVRAIKDGMDVAEQVEQYLD